MIELIISRFNMYLVPPILSLIIGTSLAVLSLVKGRLKKENVLFALVCIWYNLLSPMFICHHLIADEHTILTLERHTHMVYVFIIPITVIFFHHVLNKKGRMYKALEIFLVFACLAISITTHSELYFTGMFKFTWGYIAKGGPTFQIFGAMSMSGTIYGIVLTAIQLKREKNQIVRMKIKYILTSVSMMALLTITNIPAMNGIDSYPFGNFMFVPLMIMGYSILRYRLLDVRSIIHLTLIWLALSSAILIPNILVFKYLSPYFGMITPPAQFLLLGLLFLVNFSYFRRVQPFINRTFDRQKFNLRKLESQFIEDISLLKSLEGLINEVTTLINSSLALSSTRLFLRMHDSGRFASSEGESFEINPDVESWFLGANHLVEKNMVETNPYYESIRSALEELFTKFDCVYIVPMIQNDVLLGLMFFGEKKNLKQLSADEIRFINNIRTAASISLANSIMYQNLSNMKDNLETMVKERTRELQTKNDQMIFELKVAKNVQRTIFPVKLPATEQVSIVTRLEPLMEVSGDFYDVIETDNDRVIFALADVSGHGVPSALLTSMIKTEFEAQSKRHSDPGRLCAAMNEVLTPVLIETGFYFTMFLGIINTRTMELEYTNCGHTQPFLRNPDGTIRTLDTEGFFIGASPDATYGTERLKPTPGSRLFLFTDGITEARADDGEFYGDDRLIESIQQSCREEIKSQLGTLFTNLAEYQGQAANNRTDDMTMMIVEFGSASEERQPAEPVRSEMIRKAIGLYKSKEYDRGLEVLTSENGDFQDPYFMYLLSKFYLRTRQDDQALESINGALKKEPSNIEYLYQKSKCLLMAGKTNEAVAVLRDIESKDAAYKKVSDFLKRFQVSGKV